MSGMPIFPRGRDKDLPQTPDKTKLALEAALRVSEIGSSGAALPEAVQGMVTSAIELLGAGQGSIMLLEEDGQTLTLVASYGLPTEVPVGYSVRVGESVAGRVLATGKPLLLGDIDKEAFVNFVPKERPISSSIVVPLRVQGRGIGVLNLAITSAQVVFDQEDLRVAQMFADQAAGVIYRARLHEQAEHRSSDLMALVESSRGLLGPLDVESLLQAVLDGGARLSGSNEGFACLFDAESGSISRGIFRGMQKDVIGKLLQDENVKTAIDRVDVSVFDDPAHGALVAVGLRTTRGTKGVMVLEAEREVVEERRHLFRAFGQQCDTALGSAELYSEVERKETELSSIIHGVPNPIILIDARGKIVAINPACEQVFSISGMFTAGSPAIGTIGHPEVERLLSADGDLQGEVIAGNPPKTYKVRVTDVHVPGAPMGRVLIMDDVTAEREIVQTQRDFVAMIGHELRTPLTIIKGFARTLLRRVETASPEDAREALKTIDVRAGQLERLIEDLLYVSKIESREASLRIEQVKVRDLVQRVSEEIIGEYPEREVVLEISSKMTWPCDEQKVELVIRHLVDNALKYSESPSAVVVRANDDDDELRVDVLDKGIGIVSSDITHIFERFKQVDASSTREHGGTGVGLYLCAQLVRVHNGRIWVDSTWGKGSTFSFSLPRRAITSDVVRIRNKQAAAES
ncbi:MAG: two-component system, OmpR family, phosphate regulon sensor histidine kinase PhoR [Actinomycetota bacterium]|jgi:two-component system phosphate regulon sensor histidine kinase PhoR|nr:two-component system, OmpR family, phosphate regulon sensor histidine kinase PhoR [Actinomycetota bacterium]